MPNWYTTKLTLRGSKDALTAFMDKHVVTNDEEKLCLDFNTIIPMPEVLEQTEHSTRVDYGLALLGKHNLIRDHHPFGPSDGLEEILEYPWVKEAGVTDIATLKDLLLKKTPDCVEIAKTNLAAHGQTGYLDWYSWRVENWGTKWNSWGLTVRLVSGRQIRLMFYTAWDPPIPVIRKLTQIHPAITFAARGQAEGKRWTSLDLDSPDWDRVIQQGKIVSQLIAEAIISRIIRVVTQRLL